METEGRFLSTTSASFLRDTRFAVGVACRSLSAFSLVVNLLTVLVGGIGGESTPAPLTSTADKRSSALEQAPISDRPCDRLNILNPQNNIQTVPKRRPGET